MGLGEHGDIGADDDPLRGGDRVDHPRRVDPDVVFVIVIAIGIKREVVPVSSSRMPVILISNVAAAVPCRNNPVSLPVARSTTRSSIMWPT